MAMTGSDGGRGDKGDADVVKITGIHLFGILSDPTHPEMHQDPTSIRQPHQS